MGHKAKEATGCDELTVLADRGLFQRRPCLPAREPASSPSSQRRRPSNNPNRGLFSGADFICDVEHDHYTCPAGQHLTKGTVRSDRRDDMDHYRNLSACEACVLNSRCTTDKHKRVKRWLHEGVLDKMQARLDRLPEAMTIRRQTVEHPFGTLKAWMGSTHFLTKTLDKVLNRDELAGSCLQHEAHDQHLRRQTAHAGNCCLIKSVATQHSQNHLRPHPPRRGVLRSGFHTASVRSARSRSASWTGEKG